MKATFYALGSIAFAIYIWQTYKRWREKRWVKRSLAVGAGLDHIPGHRHILYRRLIWCSLILGFVLMIAIPMLMH